MKLWFRILLNAVLACAAVSGARAAGNLDITGVSALPGSVTPGQAVRFTVTISNTAAAPDGGGPANDFNGGTVDITLQLISPTEDPINLGMTTTTLGVIAAGGSTDLIISRAIPTGYSQSGAYYVAATLNFAPASRATATANLSGSVDRIYMNSFGSGYTSPPTVTIAPPGGGGTTATATAVLASGAVIAIHVTNPGSGYTTAPSVTVAAPGGGTTATASSTVISGVSSVTVNTAGAYSSTPRIMFTGGAGGNYAEAAATVGGGITAIAVTNQGSRYTVAPDVVIAGGGPATTNNAVIGISSFTTESTVLTITGTPDLDITSINYPAGVSYRGGDVIPMSLTFVNRNASNGTPSVPFVPTRRGQPNFFRVQVVLSSNPVYGDADDFLLTFHDVPLTVNADNIPFTASWNQLLPGNFSGSYYVLAKIDSLNQVGETVEEDLSDAGNNIWLDVNATRIAILPSTFPTIYLASNTGTATPGSVTSGNGYSDNPSITTDGRYLAFASDATNLVTGDTNSARDIFLFDSQVGSVRRLNFSQQGAQGNANSHTPAISGNGRYVTFSSDATNLVFGDNNGFTDIFVVDTITGAISRLSLATDGTQANNSSFKPAISTTGRYVVFESSATNLVSPATAVGVTHIYLRDRDVSGSGTFDTVGNVSTVLISRATGASGTAGDRNSIQAAISGDGLFVAYASDATNLVAGDTNGYRDIFVRDIAGAATTRVSVSTAGAQATAGPTGATGANSRSPSISGDGRYVAFSSDATDLVASDTNNISDVFVRDRTLGTTTRMSVSNSGGQTTDPFNAPFQLGSFNPNISTSGRYVAFASLTNNLTPGDAAGQANTQVSASVVGGAVTGYTITNPGGGLQYSGNRAVFYRTIPNVTISGGGGSGATATATLSGGSSGYLTGITPVSGGTGYTSAPTVTVVQSFNLALNIFVMDRDVSGDGTFDTTGDISTSLVSVNRFGYQSISVISTQSSPAADIYPVISGDGRWVGLPADSETSPGLSHTTTNLISNDNNSARDVFLHDRRLNTLPNPTNPPVVNITSPGAGSSALVNTAISVTASATTSIGVVARVQFFVDGTSIGTSTVFPYTATWTPTAVGNYTLSAIVTDSFGNTGISPNIGVTINAAPSIGITAPTSSATVTAGTAQTITAVAAASNPGATISAVQFFVNGAAIGTATVSPYTTQWTPAAAGTYTLTATATDSVGTQTTSAPVVITVTPPGGGGGVTPPSISIASPGSGSTVIINTPTVVTATATASGGTVTSVEFFANGIAIGTSTTYPYRVTWTPITLGTFAITATATDHNGTQATSAAANVTVAAGTAPIVTLITPAGNTIIPAGSTQNISATASSSVGNIVSIAFYANNVLLGTDLTFPYAQSWTPTGPGLYTIKAVATDSSGMEGTSTVVQVSVTGNLPALPTVAVTNPANGSLITVNTPQTIIATASSTSTIQSVDFFANGAPLGTATSFPYVLNWTPTALGAYAITAMATDAFGQQSTSAPVAVSVERGSSTLPAVFITSPATATSVVVNRAVFVSAQAVDLDGEVASVEFFANNQSIGVTGTAPYSTSWVPTAAGNYNITAVVMDNAGNRVTSAITALTVTPAVGLAPLSLLDFNNPTLDTPTGTTPRPTPTTTPVPVAYMSKLLLNVSTADQDGSVTRVQFFANGTSIATVTAAPFFTVWQLNTLSDVVITALVTDNAGNSVYSNPIVIETRPMDTSGEPDLVTLVSPFDGASYVTGGQIIFSATHNFGTVNPPKIDFYVNGSQFSTDSTAPYQTLLALVRAGTYVIHAVARSGNVTTVSAPARITVSSNTAPAVSITSPVSGTSFVVGTGLTIAAAASDPDGTIQDVQFFVNGSSLSTDATTPYTATWNPGAAGTYRLTAMATDNAGNQTLSAVVVVTLTGNNPPTVSITTPSSGLLTNSGSAVALTAQAADADGTIASVRFLANGIVVGTPVTAAPFTSTWTPSAAGTYTLIAQATDDSGNVTSSAPVSVIVSANVAPVVALTSPTNGMVVRTGNSVTLAATASDADGTIASVRFLANGTAVGTPDTTAPYSVAWTPNSEGVFRITAIALDSSGISTTSAAATVLVVAPGAGDTIYSGTFAGLGESGRFAAINLGGTSASFIGVSTPLPGSSTAPTIYYYPSLPVDAVGGFSRTDASGRTIISGLASESGISGTLDNSRLIFIGPIALGATSVVPPGYYTGNLGGRLGSTLAVIVGADGSLMAYVADGAYRDAGSGTVTRNGAFVITLVSGNRITGTIDPATGFVSGSIGGTVVAGVTAALSSGVSFSDGFLRNLSTRGQVGTGANLLIAGFVVGGNTSKQVLVRAIGPSLAAFGVGGVLADPQLEIYSGNNLIATNNNWGGGLPIVDASNRVGAFPLPQNSLDAVLMLTLSPGSYTAQVRGVANGTGVALVELYDVDSLTPFSPQKVMNVASRGVVGTGQAQLIAGFVVSGNTPKKILVRGVGPTLSSFGVEGALADPILTITRSDGLAVRENDNWETGNDSMLIAAAAERVRAFALGAGSRDAALLIQLPPGSYTAQVTGAGNTTGVALVEVYEVP